MLEIPQLTQKFLPIHARTARIIVSNVSMETLVKLVLPLDSTESQMDLLALNAMLRARPATTPILALPAKRLPL